MGAICNQCSAVAISQFVKKCHKQSEQQWAKRLKLKSDSSVQGKYGLVEKDRKGIIFRSAYYYEGQIFDNKASGKGLQIYQTDSQLYPERQAKYEGFFANNQRQGRGRYEDQSLIFQGQWKQGLPTHGNLTIKDGLSSKSKYQLLGLTFNNRNMNGGLVNITLPDKSKYDGEFIKNPQTLKYQFSGEGTMIFPDKSTYTGGWSEGKFHRKGLYKWANSECKYHGEYVKGIKHGEGQYYILHDKYVKGRWQNGKKQGRFQVFEKIFSSESKQGSVLRIGSVDFIDDQLAASTISQMG